jgi:hypothetical protein
VRKTGLLSLTIRLAAEEHSALCAKPNRSAWVRNAIDEKQQREATRPAKPPTALGRKLLAARAEFQPALLKKECQPSSLLDGMGIRGRAVCHIGAISAAVPTQQSQESSR